MSDVIWERTDYPPEPAGPVWDQDGGKWERCGHSCGRWRSTWTSCRRWKEVCQCSLRLTTAPPWKPEVGGTVETKGQYAALPEGSIVARDRSEAWWLDAFGVWNSSFAETRFAAPPSDGATILRVGWES